MNQEYLLRKAEHGDLSPCAEICYKAFADIANRHNFPPDFPNAKAAAALLDPMIKHNDFYGVVGEVDGKIAGSNFLDERGEIVGLGPITVSVDRQNGQMGKLLMQHCLDRCEQRGVRGIRLLQAAYHNRSLALYTRLGFDVQDVLSTLQGPAIGVQVSGYRVRAATEQDARACNELHQEVHGHERAQELGDAIRSGTAMVAEEGENISAYCSSMGFGGFAVSRNNDGLKALIGSAGAFLGPGIILPSGNGEVMRWCLEHGLMIVQQLTIMTKGFYQRPKAPYMPSILY